MEPAFRRNTAERVYLVEAAHNRRSQVQILPPLLESPAPAGLSSFRLDDRGRSTTNTSLN